METFTGNVTRAISMRWRCGFCYKQVYRCISNQVKSESTKVANLTSRREDPLIAHCHILFKPNIYIYIQVIHIFALFDIYFDYILAIILSSPRIRQFCFIFGG